MEVFARLPENFPFFTVIVGLVTAVVCIFLKAKAAKIVLLCAQGLSAALSAGALAYLQLTGRDFVVYRLGPGGASPGAINQLRFSQIECLLATTFSLVIFLSVLGCWRYVQTDVEPGKQNLYCILIALSGSAMMALSYTNDLFTGYVFLEILTLTSCGILMIRELGRTTVAATRYMILNLLGSGLFLLGASLLYGATGQLLMQEIRAVLEQTGSSAAALAGIAFAVAGLAIKSGMFPFHFWMPDTYGCATPASSSILSGVVSKGYIVLLLKLLLRVAGTENPAVQKAGYVFLITGVCGMLFGSFSALRQKTLNKMLAFSSAAQIGYIYAGIGIGCLFGQGPAAVFGYTAAVYHILSHALTKPLLFLTSARLYEVSGNQGTFKKLRGSAAGARAAAAGFTAGALSMVGAPLLTGFSTKVLFSVAVIRSEKLWLILGILTALAVSTLLNALYMLRTVSTIYSAKDASEEATDSLPLRVEKSVVFASAAFVLLNVAVGSGAGVIVQTLKFCFESGAFG